MRPAPTAAVRRLAHCPRSRLASAAALALLVLGAQPAAAAADAPAVPRVDDPRADGWESEVTASAIGRALAELGHLLEQPEAISPQAVAPWVAAAFEGRRLRPAALETVFADASVAVLRPAAGGEPADVAPHRGAGGLARALRELSAPLSAASDRHAKFKVVAVESSGDTVDSRQLFSLSGTTAAGVVEMHAIWESSWRLDGDEQPRLYSLAAREFEEVRTRSGSATLFRDVTSAALGANDSFERQLLRGPEHWLRRLEAALGTDIMGHSGLAVGDLDGDGLEDLYAPQPGGLPNRLYLQRPDGTARDRSAWAGADWLDRSQSALIVDLDNDGDQDLVIGAASGLLVMANDGSGRLELRAALHEARHAYSLAAADYDDDGLLDLYVTRYSPIRDDPVAESVDVPKPVPYHDARNGAPNLLLRNAGELRFVDVTEESGMDVDNRRWSFAAAWEDYDRDGDQDLYVANDFGRNCLYRNQGGSFVNVAAAAGVEDTASGMSVSWGDPDRDGEADLYVGNMFSSAGHRITDQGAFQPGASSALRRDLRRMARGNSLFLGRPGGQFVDASLEAGVAMGRWAWSSIFVDLNNDGWEDLVVANGFLTAEKPDDL